ncbi:MAG: GerW family sporulation protein [Oscillospiraceae bacterium]|nr:GerW family sporulation protein [Oscillospiraceae bacterium]
MEKMPIVELMNTTLTRIKDMVDVNTIVGQPVSTPDGTTIIPVSKVSFAFASGGMDSVPKEKPPEDGKNFGGASGAGVNINPIAFLVISPAGVKLLPVSPPAGSTIDRVVENVPTLIDKISGLVKKGKGEDED